MNFYPNDVYLKFWEQPAFSKIQIEHSNEIQLKEELLTELNRQLKNFENLGFNVIENYGIYSVDVFKYLLEYIDENYLGIEHVEKIVDTEERLLKGGELFYEILFVDMFNIYIPLILKKYEKDYPEFIVSLGQKGFRDELFSIIDTLTRTYSQAKELDRNGLKLVISLDVFDNDLEDLFNEFIVPAIYKNWENIVTKI